MPSLAETIDSESLGPRPPSHLVALDGLRGVAILLVMLVHFVGDLTPTSVGERAAVKLANYGVWGVDLFFVLSGFLITGLLWDKRQTPHYLRDFYVRRTLRIFPLYYGVLAALFLVWPALPLAYPMGFAEAARHQGWLWTYTTNVYVALQGHWTPRYVSHFWSLAVEEHFYLLWPFVVRRFAAPALVRACLGLALFALGSRIALSLAGASDVALVALTPCRLDALALGAVLAVAVRTVGLPTAAKLARPALYGLSALVLLASLWNVAFASLRAFVLPLRGSLVAATFAALLLRSLVAEPESLLGRFCRAPVLRVLGKYSYGLYVFHGMLAMALIDARAPERLAQRLGSTSLAMVVFAFAGALGSLALAYASYELFEKHFLRLKDRLAPATPAGRSPKPTSAGG